MSFDWDRDCGTLVGPRDAVRTARAYGETFVQFAESYLEQWPFSYDDEPPANLVEGMVREMELAAAEMDMQP